MRIDEAVLLRTSGDDEDLTESAIKSAISRAFDKLVPNALKRSRVVVYEKGDEVLVHGYKGNDHEIVHVINRSRVGSDVEKSISAKEANALVASYKKRGFKPVHDPKKLNTVLKGIAVNVGPILGAYTILGGILIAFAKISTSGKDVIISSMPNTTPTPPPAEVTMGPPPDFPQMYKDQMNTVSFKTKDGKFPDVLSDETWEKINNEAIDRVVGRDGIFYVDSFLSHLKRLAYDEAGMADYLPGFLP